MDIQQVKLDYTWTPFLRKLDMIKSQSVKIVICSDNEAVIDIGLLQAKHQGQGQPGLKYHYVIKNNASYDGIIYYCRPRIYQNGIPGQNDKGDNMINNSISVCLAGAYGQNATSKQTDSFVNLMVFLMSQENLPLDAVMFLQETTGTGEIPNWQDLKAKLKTRIDSINSMKGIIEIPTVNGVQDTTQFGTVISSATLNTLSKVSKQTGVPESIIIQMNKHVSFGSNIPPDTVIYIPKGPYLEKLRSSQQTGIAGSITAQIDEKVNYADAISRGNYGQPNTGQDLYSEDTTFLTTQYGGKKAPPWIKTGLDFPGYHSAFIQITDTGTKKITTIPFLLSPSSSAESRSASQQMTKTNAGWFIQRTGKNPTNLNISGYMMDAKDVLEKHEFLENYKKYIEDTKNVKLEYTNPYSVKIRLEGRDYYGYIQSISFNKAAVQPYLYQYNITFVILNDKMIYDARQAAQSVNNINALIGTGQPPNVLPTPVKYTPKQTPKVSGPVGGTVPSWLTMQQTIEQSISSTFNYVTDTAKTIGSKLWNMFEKAKVDMNKAVPISYTPTKGNPGKET